LIRRAESWDDPAIFGPVEDAEVKK